MEYRATLNLPRTSFPMRANAVQREPERLLRWNETGLYAAMLERRREAPLFVLHDGPPYANGEMHLGHALNRILKDIVIKYKSMAGFRTPFVPGWDCHGLPIELQVEKEIGRAAKAELSRVEVRRRCAAYALRSVDLQRNAILRLGVVGEWDRPYLTLDPAYEATEIRELARIADNGSLYRRRKPVYWCGSCETALAEAEVEYEDKTSASIWIRFRATALGGLGAATDEAGRRALEEVGPETVALVAWTTTPWTLPANLALALNPKLKYVGLRLGDTIAIVAEGRAAGFLESLGVAESGARLTIDVAALEGLGFRHPWLEREVPVVFGDHVTLESGTGVVHTAPGHGQEDYEVGLHYGLDILSPVDARGVFTHEAPGFEGLRIFEADGEVIERIERAGNLAGRESIRHSYPHCWRCKKPLFFRATEQWFVSMAHQDLRERTLDAVDGLKWIPQWGRDRIRGMIESRPDWCISRQRIWGVPIVAVHCEDCGEAHAGGALAQRVAAIVETEGADAWLERPLEELLPEGMRCRGCSGNRFRRETDILDVWFDSGVSHAAVLEQREGLSSPADLYLEGSDQHRGWFHTSLLTSVATRGRAPYLACLTHGFILDGKGRKMSKSLGNVVAPDDVIKRLGADVLRLWVAAEDYRGDISVSDEILNQIGEAYRRIRNTARFLLGNLEDFDPDRDRLPREALSDLDRWALARLDRLKERVERAYEAAEFHTVVHALNNFCSVDLSARYLDIIKDRVYCSAPADSDRRSAQTAMEEIARSLAGLLAPILSFLAEEVWEALPRRAGDPSSILLTDFPGRPAAPAVPDGLETEWEHLLEVRAAVTKAIEGERQAGVLGHSLEAEVRLSASGEIGSLLRRRDAELAEIFIVSRVLVVDEVLPESALLAGLGLLVTRVGGAKCERCWIWRDDIGGETAVHPGVCGRCTEVLSRMPPELVVS